MASNSIARITSKGSQYELADLQARALLESHSQMIEYLQSFGSNTNTDISNLRDSIVRGEAGFANRVPRINSFDELPTNNENKDTVQICFLNESY